jgi:predicted TPR repeat methyltransferase
MSATEAIHRTVREHYDQFWQRGDPWELETSEFEQAKYARQLALLADRRYRRVLEIGCGCGCFTERLVGLADRVVALDVAASAIARARAARRTPATVEFRVANVMEYEPQAEGPWDLIVLSEAIYCLGWLYPFFNVGWLVHELHAATRPGGRFLLVNSFGAEEDYLLHPWLIRTYHDLARNVGYGIEREEIFKGTKGSVGIETLVSLFQKLTQTSPRAHGRQPAAENSRGAAVLPDENGGGE